MKPLLKLCILIGSLSLTLGASAKPVIYDTDMAIDDWFALLYIALAPDADLTAVTISASGESHCQPGLNNADNLLQLAAHTTIPIACGDSYPMDGYFIFPPEWQHDADTLSGIDLKHWLGQPVTARKSDGTAVELLHRTISTSDEPVTIVAVGPMTNIAQWLVKYPNDIKNLESLVIMGGSYRSPGNIIVPNFTDSNPNTVSEWNFFIDPVATKIVLDAALPKVMVGLDVTNTVRITHSFADDFKAHVKSPASEFADKVFDNNRWFIESGEYYFWDVMAAIVALHPNLCRGEMISVSGSAELAGTSPYLGSSDLSMPALTPEGDKRQHYNAATAGQVIDAKTTPPTLVCTSTNAAEVFEEFIQTLTSSEH